MEHRGLVKIQHLSRNGSATAEHKRVRATLRPPSLTEWYTIGCVMEELESVARANPTADLVVDFHRVGHVSVEIVPELLCLKNSLERCGGALFLCGLGRNLQELLQFTDLGAGHHFHRAHGALHAGRESEV